MTVKDDSWQLEPMQHNHMNVSQGPAIKGQQLRASNQGTATMHLLGGFSHLTPINRDNITTGMAIKG